MMKLIKSKEVYRSPNRDLTVEIYDNGRINIDGDDASDFLSGNVTISNLDEFIDMVLELKRVIEAAKE